MVEINVINKEMVKNSIIVIAALIVCCQKGGSDLL